MLPQYWLLLAVLFAGMVFSVKAGKLTTWAAMMGGIIGVLVFAGAGFTGVSMLASFFLIGTGATSWKLATKQQLGTAEKQSGRRTIGQVMANGGAAGLWGLMAWMFPAHQVLFQLMIAASLSAATADTVSSELGMLYGKKFYNIINLRAGKNGENGVVSVEGTLLGMFGSIAIASVYAMGFGWSLHFYWIVIAGTIGNIMDSVLGATLERRHYLNNDSVNLANTVAAALAGLLLIRYFE